MKLLRYFKPYIWAIIALTVLTYFQVMASLQLPDYMAKIINDGIIKENMNAIYQNGGMMLLVTLGGGLCAVGVGYLASRVSIGFGRDIRRKVFEKVESFSIAEFDTFSTASLITRSTNDIQQIQTVSLMIFRMVLMAPFMAVGALQNALNNAPGLSWIITTGTLLLAAMIVVLFSVGLPKFKIVQQLVDKLNLVTRENLTGLRVVRAFNNESVEEAKFDAANKDLMRLNLFVNRLMIILQPFMIFIMNIAIVAVVWFGAQLVSDGSIEIGNMMAFMQYAMQVIMAFLMISIIFIMIPRASVSAKRVAEVIDTEVSIRDAEKPMKPAKNSGGRIEFRDVTFTYPQSSRVLISSPNQAKRPPSLVVLVAAKPLSLALYRAFTMYRLVRCLSMELMYGISHCTISIVRSVTCPRRAYYSQARLRVISLMEITKHQNKMSSVPQRLRRRVNSSTNLRKVSSTRLLKGVQMSLAVRSSVCRSLAPSR
jgi:ATP-binding cassette subfamily B protein